MRYINSLTNYVIIRHWPLNYENFMFIGLSNLLIYQGDEQMHQTSTMIQQGTLITALENIFMEQTSFLISVGK